MKLFKKAISAFLALSMAAAVILPANQSSVFAVPNSSDDGLMRTDMSSREYVYEMGLGLNLGNTMESYWSNPYEATSSGAQTIGDNKPTNYETCWGAIVTTQEIINGIKDAGFKTIRIPVYWGNMMANDNTFTINTQYMDRVEEIVNYCRNAGLYVVINIHHYDEYLIENFPKEEVLAAVDTLWTQIANRFKGYSDYVIFEGFNEAVGSTQRGISMLDNEIYDYVNALNQTFVDAVRATGGNNADRMLIISGYNTNIDKTTDARFLVPTDTVADRIMVSVHYVDNFMYWNNNIGGQDWINYTIAQCELLKNKFTNKGIQVFLGEITGIYNNENIAGNAIYKTSSECLDKMHEILLDYGFIPVIWDTCDAFYSRTNCRITNDSDQAVISKYSKLVGMGPPSVSVTGVSLNKTTLELEEGKEETLVATVLPEGATNKEVEWKSDNTDVATVDENGKVTAVKAGEAKITVTTKDGGYTDECAVTVTASSSDVTALPATYSSDPRVTVELLMSDYGIDEAFRAEVAKVEFDITGYFNGQVTNEGGVQWGGATVDALNKAFADLSGIGDKFTFYSYWGEQTVNALSFYDAEGSLIGTLDSSGFTDKRTPSSVSVTGVSLNKTTLELEEGKEETLVATVLPEGATNKEVEWKSDNTDVATVDQTGKVTAVKAGEATITVTTKDGGYTDECAVTVTKGEEPQEPDQGKADGPNFQALKPYILTDTIGNGAVGTAYSETLLAEGAVGIEWNVSSGELPDGITLAVDGTLSGTPGAGGTYTFTVRASNAFGIDERTYTVEIEDNGEEIEVEEPVEEKPDEEEEVTVEDESTTTEEPAEENPQTGAAIALLPAIAAAAAAVLRRR